ncbi:MAG: hypothetical protein M1828_006246 [Chrysothrix sp. TS-e1954]|nr:MAG: hypothetical protein M1828_006246 [Chrysothrix sp. TS-e1954]
MEACDQHTPNTSPKKPSPLHYDSNNTTPAHGARTPPSVSSHRRSTPQQQQQQYGSYQSPTATTPSRSSMLRSESPTPSTPPSAFSRRKSSSNTPRQERLDDSERDATNALGRLPPGQLREMRESFQMLDRDNDGFVDLEDVKDMFGQIGEMPSASTLASFFPQGTTNGAMNLSTYLNEISSLLAPMSTPDELGAAFAALDDDDSGQIDVQALKRAILQCDSDDDLRYSDSGSITEAQLDSVMREFTGRRAFGKGMMGGNAANGRGEVFRWKEFTGSVSGSGKEGRKGGREEAVATA